VKKIRLRETEKVKDSLRGKKEGGSEMDRNMCNCKKGGVI